MGLARGAGKVDVKKGEVVQRESCGLYTLSLNSKVLLFKTNK